MLTKLEVTMVPFERFITKVNLQPTETCWTWLGSKNSLGYGLIWENGKSVRAHRVGYKLFYAVNIEGLEVCHKCDNPSCVNPDHLFLGTHSDNMKDMRNKNRHATGRNKGVLLNGEKNMNSKLKTTDIIAIRKLYKEGILNIPKLSSKYKVSTSCISNIIHKKRWAHVI